ncbi:hypothetical protein SAMD00019534_095420 [Acytostelium subglobosum LB1]|uniref:hypothetical protein n=1 Tax=Acytostelium subglobosum LB1 TaxID=1410327 RepID=UPI000644D641|nr:hypothetical protein SAMD00019534_099990 [Acytostelium subglobosum LB1]XP_012750921.1 hypothetical protein SAMD00019534_095420 [Acytostelium subglobosum LB1]GAM26367.1 hypothetical protein SAMD00019534_095420 [Acytostelium subglobosum LB1]GAM26824.1 hypothetical protein SAMD00019534_099990 [Acytostelium subglobosum LB1]|eukprot:XP_012750092.1 hypothetical protein SAMD00019534_099990 [Acytostelium subglobosum LB1]
MLRQIAALEAGLLGITCLMPARFVTNWNWNWASWRRSLGYAQHALACGTLCLMMLSVMFGTCLSAGPAAKASL